MSSHAHNTTANEKVGPVTLTKGTDPSNTHQIQKEFLKSLLRRFRQVRGLIRKTVGYENDALQLSSNQDEGEPVEVFNFPTSQGKVQAFMRVLREWLRENVIEVTNPISVQNGEHYSAEFLRNAYVTGVQTAQGRLMSQGVRLTSATPQEILNRPISVRQLQQIYTRAFEGLQDITEDMADTISRELTTAIRDGENPRTVADRLSKELRTLQNTRATTLARTEIIRSHAQAATDEYERAGANVVQHTARITAQDQSVCPWCRSLEDVPFTLNEFNSVVARWGSQIMRVGVPSHPRGRCSPVPKVGLDPEDLEPLDERIPDSIRGKDVTIISR